MNFILTVRVWWCKIHVLNTSLTINLSKSMQK